MRSYALLLILPLVTNSPLILRQLEHESNQRQTKPYRAYFSENNNILVHYYFYQRGNDPSGT